MSDQAEGQKEGAVPGSSTGVLFLIQPSVHLPLLMGGFHVLHPSPGSACPTAQLHSFRTNNHVRVTETSQMSSLNCWCQNSSDSQTARRNNRYHPKFNLFIAPPEGVQPH